MSEELYRATVRISPDFAGFDEETRARIDAAVPDRKDVKVGADTGDAQAKLALLDEEVKKVDRDASSASRSLSGLGGSVNLISVGIASALPALPTLLGGLGAAAGAFTAMGASALSSGAVVVTGIQQAVKANQELAAAQKAVDDATTKAGRTKALEEQAALIDKLGPSTIAFGQALSDITADWAKFADSFIPQELQLAAGFEHLEKDVLPQLRPLISNTFGVAQTEIAKLDAAVNSPGGKSFFSWLATEGPHDLQVVTDGLGHFAAGFGHLLIAFTPVERELVQGFDNIGRRFAAATQDLGTNSGFQKFLTTAERDGPLLVHTLSDVASAVGHIGLAISPVLPLELKFIDGIAQLINDHPAIAAALGAMFLGFEALKVINTIVGPLATVASIAATGAAGMFGFAGGETAIGDAAAAATPEVAALDGAMAGAATRGLGLLSVLSQVGLVLGGGAIVGAGLGAASDQAKKSGNFLTHTLGDVLGMLKSGGNFGSPDFTNNAEDFGSFVAGGVPVTSTVSGTVNSSGGDRPSKPSGQPGFFGGFGNLAKSLTQSTSSLGGIPEIGNIVSYSSPFTGGAGGGALPLTGGGGSNAAATAAQNNAAALAYLLGINLPANLAKGIADGTNPLTQTFQNLNGKLTGTAQTLANTLENIFSTALQYGQQAEQSLVPNLINGLPQMGTSTLVTVGKDGQLVRTVQSPILGGLQLTLANDQRFVADIAKARKLGLDNSLLQQFVQAGPSSLDQLDQLVNGSTDIKAVNSTFGQITSLANQYGTQQAQLQYLSEMSDDLKTLITAVVSALPPAIGKQVAAALNTAVAPAARSAAATPSKGVVAR